MAFVRERPRKDGTTTFVVQWVEPDTGKQTTRTMATRRDADELADFLTAIGPDTRARYRRMAARHITPVLGAVPVDTLTRRDVASWLNGMAGAAKNQEERPGAALGALSTAVTEGVVAGNVAKGVQPTRGEAVFLTRSELALIVDALPPRSALLAEFLAGTGLRFGEATALLGADLTLPDTPSAGADGAAGRGVVTVSKAWKTHPDADGRFVVGAPKTQCGRRTVTLPSWLAQQLAEHLEHHEIGPRGLVFPSVHGGRLSIQERHRAWGSALDELEAAGQLRAWPRIHDLRHTHASWLIAAGVPLTVIQRRLGHESIKKTTSDRYGHLADDALAAAALD
ncbi:site-specific integrase [Kocuria palustris]|uniref:tyrosine-type recombinase/integrase n=1 Tax=Kocuria palustris TaxID=71999 RepID=UPI0028D5CB26|nr:site-specific integrase [Kocuria palustris]